MLVEVELSFFFFSSMAGRFIGRGSSVEFRNPNCWGEFGPAGSVSGQYLPAVCLEYNALSYPWSAVGW